MHTLGESPRRERSDDRNPWCTASISSFRSSRRSRLSKIGSPSPRANTSGLPPLSVRTATNRHYCYLPLYITCGDHVLGVRVHPSRIDASAGAVEELERVVERIRERWPEVEITVRGDSGCCREELMGWCEQHGLSYVFGMARNPRLWRMIGREMEALRLACQESGEARRRYRDGRYRTIESWSCERRAVGKAEWLPGKRAYNPRFIATNTQRDKIEAMAPYEGLCCARGEMENRIKEQQLDLFADRTSAHTTGPTSCERTSRPSQVF